MSDTDLRELERRYKETGSDEDAKHLLAAWNRQGRATYLEGRLAARVVRLERLMWCLLGRHGSVFAGVGEARELLQNQPIWEKDALAVLLSPDSDTLDVDQLLGPAPLPDPPNNPVAQSLVEELTALGLVDDSPPIGAPVHNDDPAPPLPQQERWTPPERCPICGTSPPCPMDCR